MAASQLGKLLGIPEDAVVVRRRATPGARPPRPGARADGDPRPRHAGRAADAQPLLPAGAGRADRHARRDGGRVRSSTSRTSGVAVVGDIPAGLPVPGLPDVGGRRPDRADRAGGRASPSSAYTDNILTGRAFAARHGQTVDAQRELLALGGANLGAGLAAAASRSAAAAAGRRSATPSAAHPARRARHRRVHGARAAHARAAAGGLPGGRPRGGRRVRRDAPGRRTASWSASVGSAPASSCWPSPPPSRC